MDGHGSTSHNYFDGPSFFLQGFLDSMSPTEVFACENGTLFFHQDENFFLAIGEIICLCLLSMFLFLMLTCPQFF